MRKVIGIGETILDILFKDSQPTAAVPGGSVFNGIISLGRLGVNVTFISETGNDKVGDIILKFMRENGVSTDHVNVFPEGKSPVSLAFLNEQNDAEYLFYKGEFYQFNLSSCIRQQNSLTAQFVSFSLSNLANIFYPPPIFTIINLCLL